MENLKITKWVDEKSNCGVSSITLKRDGRKELMLSFAGNLDLYFSLKNFDEDPTFIITKDNYEVYEIFDTLYHNVINGNIFPDEELNQTTRKYLDTEELIQNDEIIWKSDDFLDDIAPYFKITKCQDEYHIMFGIPEVTRDLSSEESLYYHYYRKQMIPVRIRNSGTRYGFFNVPFMCAYSSLLDLSLEYHQIHIEEYLYNQRVLKK